jgi:hypothetical protein
VLAKGNEFLLLIRHLPCYTYSQIVVETTIRKQVAQIRHFLQTIGWLRQTIHRFYAEIVVSGHDNTELRM